MEDLSNRGNILLFDGAMGTYYRESSKNPMPECEMANLFDREEVKRIHREYIEAGARAIKTNTFGANTVSMNCNRDVVRKIIEEGVGLLKEVIAETDMETVNSTGSENGDISGYENMECDSIEIFADIGPIKREFSDKDISGEHQREILDEYRFIVDIFLENGVRNFLFETFYSMENLKEISAYIKEKDKNTFVMTSFAINPEGLSREGFTGEELLNESAAVDSIDATGLNCVSGPHHIFKYLEKIKIPFNKPVSISPNAGYPTVINNRSYYSNSSSYYVKQMEKILSLGIKIVGGCCGTTPEYIEKLGESVKKFKYLKPEVKENLFETRIISKTTENGYFNKIKNGQKVIAVELDPPSDINVEKYMANARKLRDAGVDAITIADCPIGRAKVSSALMAVKIKNEIGVDPIVHMACRDRNLNATKALLLGLNIENINNLIVVTGDPVPTAERDEVKAVFNFNSKLLARYIKGMNDNVFSNKMCIGAALNVNARNFDQELKRAMKKQDMGVDIFYTQPVVSEKAVKNIETASKVLSSKIIGGIIPVVSHRNAVFMNEEILGIDVDEEIVEKYAGLSREEASRLAVEISTDFVHRITPYVDGYYLITPFNRVDIITEIIDNIKNK